MEQEEKYIKGFNSGYFIAKHESNLSYILEQNLSCANNYLQGFFDGREQLQFDKNLEELVRLKIIRQEKDDLEQEIN